MKPETGSETAPLAIGTDIGKEVFHLVGLGVDGKTAFRRRIRRLGLKDAFEKLPPCIIGMEACLSAHFVSRTLRALGHEPRIIPAIYVRPFVKGKSNDMYRIISELGFAIMGMPSQGPVSPLILLVYCPTADVDKTGRWSSIGDISPSSQNYYPIRISGLK